MFDTGKVCYIFCHDLSRRHLEKQHNLQMTNKDHFLFRDQRNERQEKCMEVVGNSSNVNFNRRQASLLKQDIKASVSPLPNVARISLSLLSEAKSASFTDTSTISFETKLCDVGTFTTD